MNKKHYKILRKILDQAGIFYIVLKLFFVIASTEFVRHKIHLMGIPMPLSKNKNTTTKLIVIVF